MASQSILTLFTKLERILHERWKIGKAKG